MFDTLALTAWTIAAALLTGMLLALLGSLKLAVARRPQRVAGPLSVLLVLLNVVLVPLLLASGLAIDHWGLLSVMVAGPVLLSLAFLALSAGTGYRRTQAAVAAAGLAGAAVATAGVVLMPRALFGEGELVASLQLGTVFVALGALVSAPLVDLLFRALGYRRTMALLALASLLPAFLVALIPQAQLELHPPAGAAAGLVAGLLDDPGVWLGCLVFFLYAPLEGFVSVWVSSHLAGQGRARQAQHLLAWFWVAVLASRLLLAVVQHSAGLRDTLSPWLLVLPALLTAVVLGNLAAVNRIGVGLFLLGLFMGPIYPFLVGLLFRTPGGEAMPATAYGLLCASGSLGALGLSPLVGYCAHSRNRQVALLVPMFLALVLTGAALVFSLRAVEVRVG